jgi:SpoVK/Ycf46/Vps4 family AAA+-type ATPase
MPLPVETAAFPPLESSDTPAPVQVDKGTAPVEAPSAETPAPQVLPAESVDDVLAEVDANMVGCERPKREFRELIAFNRIEAERVEDGLPTDPLTLHMAMYGPPGTGKTEFAKYTARAYRAMGVLETGHCVETTMADLIGKVVGETAPKTRAKIEEALGGVLFIDEFYTDEAENQVSFTPEMVKELIVQMETHRHELVVIVAGYEEKVRSMLSLNPGLRDRIPRKMHFESYTADELQQIFMRFLARSGLELDLGAYEALARTINEIRDAGRTDPNFANARAMRNLYDDTRRAQASRLHELPVRSRADRQLLTAIDIEDAGARYRSNSLSDGTHQAKPRLIVP